MPDKLTRRRLLHVGALAAGGFGIAWDEAFAQELAPTPQCHDGDPPTVRQSEGPFFKPSSPQRADLIEPNAKARVVELSGQVLTRVLPPGRACAHRPLAQRRARRLRQPRLSLSRAHLHRRRRPLPVPHHPARALSRPHPPLSRQGAGAAAAGAHHPALFPRRRGRKPSRWSLPPRAADAHGGGGRRACRALRFRARPALAALVARMARSECGRTLRTALTGPVFAVALEQRVGSPPAADFTMSNSSSRSRGAFAPGL